MGPAAAQFVCGWTGLRMMRRGARDPWREFRQDARMIHRSPRTAEPRRSLLRFGVAAGIALAAAGTRASEAAVPPDARAVIALEELARHEPQWNSPGLDAAGSMPIGNGAYGANAWVEANGDIVLLLSHAAAFSEAERLLKLGAVRITCDPPLPTAPFMQRMSFAEGAIVIEAGGDVERGAGFAQQGSGAAQQDARAAPQGPAGAHAHDIVRVRIFVESGADVLHATVASESPRAVRVRFEGWRGEARRLEGEELKSAWVMRDAPADERVTESADRIRSREELPDAVAWYHRNEHSVVPRTLEHQGLAEFAVAFGDPLLQRTFGGQIEGSSDGAPFVRVADDAMASPAPARTHAVRIAAKCSQFDDLADWLAQLDELAAGHADSAAAARTTAAWWSDRFARSWVYVDAPRTSLLENAHPLRVGYDSNTLNRFVGEIPVVRFHPGVLRDDEVAAIAAGGECPGATVVATANDATFRLPPALARAASFSVDAWINPKSADGTGRIVDKMTAGGTDGILLDLQGGRLRAIVGSLSLQSELRPLPGVRSHVAVTFDADLGELSLYLDGAAPARATGAALRRGPTLSQAYAAQRAVTLAASFAEYPIKFNGSIFTVPPRHVNGAAFNADFRNWGGDYWWQNTRLPYHGMLARGDGDGMPPLFRLYGDALRGCTARARAYHGVDGAYFPETMTIFGTYGNGDYGWNRAGLDRRDVQCPYWQWAWNQGPELVALMLEHFDHTGDEKVLLRRTLPIAREVLAYFDTRFARDAAGRLVIDPTQSLETYWTGVVNDLPTVAGLREVTARLLALPARFGAPDERALWERLRRACPEIPRTADGRCFAPAERFDPQRSNCENPELYAVWPFRLADADLGVGRATFAARRERISAGWPQDGMQAARLGLADEAAAQVRARLANTHPNFRYPVFWGPNFDWLPDQCHGGNLLTTVQEMLLQSDGARIRVLPAWPKEWDARFRLHAAARTVVTGEVRGGRKKAGLSSRSWR